MSWRKSPEDGSTTERRRHAGFHLISPRNFWTFCPKLSVRVRGNADLFFLSATLQGGLSRPTITKIIDGHINALLLWVLSQHHTVSLQEQITVKRKTKFRSSVAVEIRELVRNAMEGWLRCAGRLWRCRMNNDGWSRQNCLAGHDGPFTQSAEMLTGSAAPEARGRRRPISAPGYL